MLGLKALSLFMEAVELKVHVHCKVCEKSIRRALFKLKGVTCVDIDVISSKITVLGYAEQKAIIKAVRRTGRRVEPQPPRCRESRSSNIRRFLCFRAEGFEEKTKAFPRNHS